MAKKSRIIQPGDNEAVQLGLFSVANTGEEEIRMKNYPKVYRDVEGFKKVVSEVTDMCGLDFEFNTTTLRPTVIGVSNYKECAAVFYTPEIMEWLEKERKSRGFIYSGHAVLTADRQVLEKAVGYETNLEDWSDSMLTFWSNNSDLTKNPGKDDDGEGGLGFMGLGVMASLTTDLPNHKNCRGRNCEELICPRHDVRGYCAVDAYTGLLGDRASRLALEELGVPAKTIDELHALQELTVRMQQLGIAVDREYIKKLDKILEDEQDKLFPAEGEEGYLFNPRSPKELTGWFKDQGLYLGAADKETVKTVLEHEAAKEGYEDPDGKFELVYEQLIQDKESLSLPLKALLNVYTYKVLGKGTTPWFADRYFGKDGKLHPRFVVTGTSTGRLSSSSPNFQNCLSGDTEILTSKGWQRFDSLEKGLPVAQWDPNGSISYVVPSNYIENLYTGPLVSLINEHVDFLGTPDHRCPLFSRKTGVFSVFPASEYPEDRIQPNAGIYSGGNRVVDENYLKLLIAVQADGHFNGYGIVLNFKKNRKKERLTPILEALGVDFSYSYYLSKTGWRHNFYLKQSELVARLETDLSMEKKLLPGWFRELPLTQRQLIVDEVTQWDGLARSRSEYYSKYKENCDLVQELATGVGYRTSIAFYKNSTGGSTWIVRYTFRNYSMTTNIRRGSEVVENFLVYCVEVPTSFIVVRRNGKVFITGNCSKRGYGKKLRKAVIPHNSENVFVEMDFSQMELRDVLYLAGVDPSTAGADAFSWLVREGKGAFEAAGQKFGLKPRDLAKVASHSSNYLIGFRLLSEQELTYARTKSEYNAGALRIYHPDFMEGLDSPWIFQGKVVSFTGSKLAQQLFKDKSFESRKKALEIQEDIYFKTFPMIREWQRRELTKWGELGYVMSPAHRFLRLNDIPEKNGKLIVAFLGQGVGASHAQAMMLRFYREKGIVFNSHIHDSFVFEWKPDFGEIWGLKEFMEGETPLLPGFKCPAVPEVGINWGQMKELKYENGLYMLEWADPRDPSGKTKCKSEATVDNLRAEFV